MTTPESCCAKCERYPNYMSCDCHPLKRYDHCENCSDDDEFVKNVKKTNDDYYVDDNKFEMIRGRVYPSRRARRLYKILTKGVELEKGDSIKNRTDKNLIKVLRALEDNFNAHRCRITCDECTPMVLEYDIQYKDFMKQHHDDSGDENLNTITFDVSNYILSVIPEDVEHQSKEQLVELLGSIKRMCCEDTF